MQIGNLVSDCRTGIPLLRVEDHLQPGAVQWKQAAPRGARLGARG